MATFNFDFNRYKPSSKGGESLVSPKPLPTMSPTATATMSAAPRMTPAPQASAPKPLSIPKQTTQFNQNKGSFFTGSTLDKVFDVLNAPMYAFSGFLSGAKNSTNRINKEMGFGDNVPAYQLSEKRKQLNKPLSVKEAINRLGSGFKEGVSNIAPAVAFRQGFGTGEGDFNFGGELSGNRGSQVAANFLTDISVPNIPVEKVASPILKIASKAPGLDNVPKLLSKADKYAKETPFIYNAIEKVNPYFRRPEFGKMLTESERVANSRISELYREVKGLSKGMSPSEQKLVTAVVEGRATNAPRKIVEAAREVSRLGDEIGQEAVDLGLLNIESFNKYKGRYISHVFDNASKGGLNFTPAEVARVAGKQFSKRTGAEGFIEEFAPATFKGLGNELKDIEVTKFYRDVANKFGQKIIKGQIPEGYVRASEVGVKGRKFGKSFARIAIPQEVADYLTRSTTQKGYSLMDKALNMWKVGKTITNPSYHARNLMSNQILSEMSTGEGIPLTVAKYGRSIANYFDEGNEFVKTARKAGLIGNENLGSGFDELLEGSGLRSKGKLRSAVSGITKAPGAFQNVSEETAKLNVFRTWIERFAKGKGISPTEALKDSNIVKQAVSKAEEAIFSPYNISKQERGLAKNIVPFYSFTRQSVPFIGKTIAKYPNRFTQYEKGRKFIEELSADEVKSNEVPDYYKNYIRLPVKNREGKYTYLDPQYILPWGNFMNDDQVSGSLPGGISLNPIVTTAINSLTNFDPFLRKDIVNKDDPSWKQREDLTTYLRKQLGPAFPNSIIDKILPAAQGKTDYKGREYDLVQAVLNAVFGIRTYQASPEELRSKKKLQEVYNLRSKKSRKSEIMKDQSLSESERQKLLNSF